MIANILYALIFPPTYNFQAQISLVKYYTNVCAFVHVVISTTKYRIRSNGIFTVFSCIYFAIFYVWSFFFLSMHLLSIVAIGSSIRTSEYVFLECLRLIIDGIFNGFFFTRLAVVEGFFESRMRAPKEIYSPLGGFSFKSWKTYGLSRPFKGRW